MKIWLDDVRPCPEGWVHCHSVNEILQLLSSVAASEVEEVSLDHDLGDYYDDGGDGWRVVDWMAEHSYWPKVVFVHSANFTGVKRMLGVLDTYGPYRTRPTHRSRAL